MTDDPPAHAIDWRGDDWTPDSDTPAAHPNARFTTPAAQCPSIAPEWEDPAGVPIDAILFGGRRASVVPLVHEALDWEHGVFLGSIMGSETTAAQAGEVGALRFDPMAMLPFCGYHMGDYFAHWLRSGEREGAQLPRIFMVNWFRKDDDGQLPVAGLRREQPRAGLGLPALRGRARARSRRRSGCCPTEGSLDTEGLDVSPEDLAELLRYDPDAWRAQLPQVREHLARFGDRLPPELRRQLDGARAHGLLAAARRGRSRPRGAKPLRA